MKARDCAAKVREGARRENMSSSNDADKKVYAIDAQDKVAAHARPSRHRERARLTVTI